jgi:hypothetical protein
MNCNRLHLLSVLALVTGAPPTSFLCPPARAEDAARYRDPGLPVEVRVEDLLSRLTLA